VFADPLEHIRSLFYALRFCPYSDFDKLNRACSSSFAALELFAIHHADVLGVTNTTSLERLRRVRAPTAQVTIACLADRGVLPWLAGPDSWGSCGLEGRYSALVATAREALRLQELGGCVDRVLVVTGSGQYFHIMEVDGKITPRPWSV